MDCECGPIAPDFSTDFGLRDRFYGVHSFPKKCDKTGKLVRKICLAQVQVPGASIKHLGVNKFICLIYFEARLRFSTNTPESPNKTRVGQDKYPMPIDDVTEKEGCIARLQVANSIRFYIGSLGGTADSMLKDGYRQARTGIKPDKKQGQKKRQNANGGDELPSNLTTNAKIQATKKKQA